MFTSFSTLKTNLRRAVEGERLSKNMYCRNSLLNYIKLITNCTRINIKSKIVNTLSGDILARISFGAVRFFSIWCGFNLGQSEIVQNALTFS